MALVRCSGVETTPGVREETTVRVPNPRSAREGETMIALVFLGVAGWMGFETLVQWLHRRAWARGIFRFRRL